MASSCTGALCTSLLGKNAGVVTPPPPKWCNLPLYRPFLFLTLINIKMEHIRRFHVCCAILWVGLPLLPFPCYKWVPWQHLLYVLLINYLFVSNFLLVTPLDVVKIRLQAQQKALLSNKCFLYCNGLMDHLCPCVTSSGGQTNWYHRNGQFTGTIVSASQEKYHYRNSYVLFFLNKFEYLFLCL